MMIRSPNSLESAKVVRGPLTDCTVILQIDVPGTSQVNRERFWQENQAALECNGVHRLGLAEAKTSLLNQYPMLAQDVEATGGCGFVVSRGERGIPNGAGRDLEGIQVVIAFLPLVRMVLPAWQREIQEHRWLPFESWLQAGLGRSAVTGRCAFLSRFRYDEVASRWASAVGSENVTVVVVAESDPRRLLSTFESMLRVPSGTLLTPDAPDRRDLTLAEVQLLEHLNRELEECDLDHEDYTALIRAGAVPYMRSRVSDGEKPYPLPSWAVDQIIQISTEAVVNIDRLGVRVVGDLQDLCRPPGREVLGDGSQESHVPVGTAASLAIGVLSGLWAQGETPNMSASTTDRLASCRRRITSRQARLRRMRLRVAARSADPRNVEGVSSVDLLRMVVHGTLRRWTSKTRHGR